MLVQGVDGHRLETPGVGDHRGGLDDLAGHDAGVLRPSSEPADPAPLMSRDRVAESEFDGIPPRIPMRSWMAPPAVAAWTQAIGLSARQRPCFRVSVLLLVLLFKSLGSRAVRPRCYPAATPRQVRRDSRLRGRRGRRPRTTRPRPGLFFLRRDQSSEGPYAGFTVGSQGLPFGRRPGIVLGYGDDPSPVGGIFKGSADRVHRTVCFLGEGREGGPAYAVVVGLIRGCAEHHPTGRVEALCVAGGARRRVGAHGRPDSTVVRRPWLRGSPALAAAPARIETTQPPAPSPQVHSPLDAARPTTSVRSSRI